MEEIYKYCQIFISNGGVWVHDGSILLGAILAGWVVHGIAFYILVKLVHRRFGEIYAEPVAHIRYPSRLLLIMVFFNFALPIVNPTGAAELVLKKAGALLLIFAVGWTLIRVIEAANRIILDRFQMNVPDNLEARRIHTQLQVIRRVIVVVIFLLTLATGLMVFDRVRQLGASILASAGIAGIILGFAAQRSLTALIAGLQLAITQPIRIDDVVIVEGEWGRIEEITITYVVVKIWDERRLVVPTNYFIEKSFQNWTRTSSQLLGSVFLYLDYCVPVEEVRNKLTELLKQSPHWDGRVNTLQVTDANEKTLELRALMSAKDAGTAWELRCEIREKLINFIQEKYPDYLPRLRSDIEIKQPDRLHDDQPFTDIPEQGRNG